MACLVEKYEGHFGYFWNLQFSGRKRLPHGVFLVARYHLADRLMKFVHENLTK